MNVPNSVLKSDERAVFQLRSLYGQYGYSQFKMSKFEEYELYARNKSFLVSDHVITFTDTNGKLMALKPDVTLSIVKNSKDMVCGVQKVYYDENVYRVSKRTQSFREIKQVGLECIGEIDLYCISEVLMLAARSLSCISEDFVLDISHLGVVSAILARLQVSEEQKSVLLGCIGEKNLHGLEAACAEAGISKGDAASLCALISTYGPACEVLPILRAAFAEGEERESVEQLAELCDSLCDVIPADKLRLDFSVVSDAGYYNGIAFKGFVRGISTDILSGGQYDNLMRKMNKRAGAIGFALYLDRLEELSSGRESFDVDTVLLYGADTPVSAVRASMDALIREGKTVSAQRAVPEKMTYRQLLRVGEKGVESVEADA